MEHLLTPETLVIGFAGVLPPTNAPHSSLQTWNVCSASWQGRPPRHSGLFRQGPPCGRGRHQPHSGGAARLPRRTLPGPRLLYGKLQSGRFPPALPRLRRLAQYSPTPPRGFGHQRHETARQRRREPEHIRRLVVRRLQPPERLDHRPRSHHRTAQQRTKRLRRRRSPLHPAGKRRPPLYFERDATGLPARWIGLSKRSLKSLTPMYSTNRMLNDYLRQYYLRAARRRNMLAENDWAACRAWPPGRPTWPPASAPSRWRKSSSAAWKTILCSAANPSACACTCTWAA